VPDTELLLNLAKHAGLIAAAALILLAISPVQHAAAYRKSHLYTVFLIFFFGFFGIMGTYSGNQIFDSFANLRAMSIITAGLYAGPLVGTGAGLMAGLHRLFIDPWGFSAIPCALATLLEGLAAGLLSRRLGRFSRDWKVTALVCFLAEGVHMLMVLTMCRPFADALALVKIIALPMMLANPAGAALFMHLIKVLFDRKEERESIQARNVLAIANETVRYFRGGLSTASASKTARIIFDRLAVAAVAITDTRAVLVHVGTGADHNPVGQAIRSRAARAVLAKGSAVYHKNEKAIGCRPQGCPFNSVIVVPLQKKRHIIGTLSLYGTKDIALDKIQFKIAQGLSALFATQFELGDLQTKEQLLAHTRIRHLQAQINPHFLFNSLNTIASFCRTDPQKSRDLILDLSSYMRKNLDSSRGFVSLSDELKQVRSYLAIEQARFGDRVQASIDVDPDCLQWPVPPLIIQPLVENSVKHGILGHENGGRIHLRIAQHDQMLAVAITDDGAGMTPEQVAAVFRVPEMESQDAGVGLVNTNLRLEQIYGPEHRLAIQSEPDKGTVVAFSIPALAAAA